MMMHTVLQTSNKYTCSPIFYAPLLRARSPAYALSAAFIFNRQTVAVCYGGSAPVLYKASSK